MQPLIIARPRIEPAQTPVTVKPQSPERFRAWITRMTEKVTNGNGNSWVKISVATIGLLTLITIILSSLIPVIFTWGHKAAEIEGLQQKITEIKDENAGLRQQIKDDEREIKTVRDMMLIRFGQTDPTLPQNAPTQNTRLRK